MLRDPFLEGFLTAYFDASDRYNHAVDEMSQLAGKGEHRKFALVAARVRELAVLTEEAYSALLKRRLESSTIVPGA